MSTIDKDKILYNLINFRSKYLLMEMNEAIIELQVNINELQTNLITNKSKLYKLILEINKYYKTDNKNIQSFKQNNNYPQKYDTEQINEVLKYYPKPDIISNNDQEEIKQNLTDIKDNIIELNKNLSKKDDNLDLNKTAHNTESMDINFTDTRT